MLKERVGLLIQLYYLWVRLGVANSVAALKRLTPFCSGEYSTHHERKRKGLIIDRVRETFLELNTRAPRKCDRSSKSLLWCQGGNVLVGPPEALA